LRVEAYGTVDERTRRSDRSASRSAEADQMLGPHPERLFDLGADLCTPEGADGMRVHAHCGGAVERLEREIDR